MRCGAGRMWLATVTNSTHRRASTVSESLTASRPFSMIRTWCRAPVWRRWCAWPNGLPAPAGDRARSISQPGGGNADSKVPALVAGMVAGADSIEDMALLRHGAMDRLTTGLRAPSTLGTFLRTFTFGHVRQLDAVASRLLSQLAGQSPLLPGAMELAYIDVDDSPRHDLWLRQAGAARGYTGVKGLNALIGIVSTPSSSPVIAAARLRKGSTNSARGAARLVADALTTAKRAGAPAACGSCGRTRRSTAPT